MFSTTLDSLPVFQTRDFT